MLIFKSIVRSMYWQSVLSPLDDGEPEYRRSAFTFYAIEHWVEYVLSNPAKTRYELLHLLRKQWDALDANAKKPYLKDEKEDAKRFVKEMKALYPSYVKQDCNEVYFHG